MLHKQVWYLISAKSTFRTCKLAEILTFILCCLFDTKQLDLSCSVTCFSISGNKSSWARDADVLYGQTNTEKHSQPKRPPLCRRSASKLTISENNTTGEISQQCGQREWESVRLGGRRDARSDRAGEECDSWSGSETRHETSTTMTNTLHTQYYTIIECCHWPIRLFKRTI